MSHKNKGRDQMSYSISEDIKEETTKGRKNLKKILGHSTQKDGMVPIP